MAFFFLLPFNLCKAKKNNMCVSDCMVFKIRVGRSGFVFLNLQVQYAPSSKITLVCFFLTTAY